MPKGTGWTESKTIEMDQSLIATERPLLTVADVMMVDLASVAASETVVAASDIIRQHNLPGLPVAEGGQIVGVVTPLQLLRQPPYRKVSEVMTAGITPASPDLSLLQAHALLGTQRIDLLPVVQEGRLVGQISLATILRAIGQQTDPLTGLPWSTALRAWASASLGRGHEVAILFIDMDNFKLVNKALGHAVGDEILRSMAALLGKFVDVSTDLLCRYGGDEFAIATTRSAEEARALAQRLQESTTLPLEIGGETRAVTASVGFAGGRRIEGRVPAHAAATVEDLLTLASRASTAAKESADVAARRGTWSDEGSVAAEARLRLLDVKVHVEPSRCTATVRISLGAQEGTGSASGQIHGRGVSFLVADATLQAITETIGERYLYTVEELTEVPFETDRLVVAILRNGIEPFQRFVGGAHAADLPHAVSKAILDALNRVLARALADLLRHNAVR
ncbi:MAG TPA: GGDEF domain-containing protein [bacterium]|nr:GGDEF domain-containing protein [bacterium]